MGLIGNILGFQGKGKIEVVVDRPYYMSGELVKGKIIVEPGTYEFPFDYQLPDNLPGSFDAKKESSGVVAKIEYSMTGTVIVDGVFARDLMKKAVLVLYTSHAGQLVQPSVDTCSRKVSYLCFDQGTCAFKASADKTVYNTTDTPQIHIDIQNGSKQNVLRIQCRLVRQDVLTAADGAIKTVRTELCDASFPGVPAHAVISQDLPFALTTKLLAPSTKGSLLVVTHMMMQHPSNMVTLPGNMGGFMMQPQVSPGMHMMSNPRPPPTNNLDTVSVDGGGPADVVFVNLTPMPIDLLWVDTVGVESFYARLHPTESYLQPTFTNHMWKVGQCGQILLAYRVRVGGQRVEVLGPGLANYF
ncbi:hypothetical protein DYB34_004203 [Aphanomyces astaci]|uniref:Uncharacterized protein n=1 Tax=Aphanomyces astaci TaxID=112090 RepID=A0A418C3X3_APHAT|nr:hypothetical protein DYB34_004203 [Aphanomyces astaci]